MRGDSFCDRNPNFIFRITFVNCPPAVVLKSAHIVRSVRTTTGSTGNDRSICMIFVPRCGPCFYGVDFPSPLHSAIHAHGNKSGDTSVPCEDSTALLTGLSHCLHWSHSDCQRALFGMTHFLPRLRGTSMIYLAFVSETTFSNCPVVYSKLMNTLNSQWALLFKFFVR